MQLQMFMPARELIELPFYEPDREYVEIPEDEYIDADGESQWEGGGERQEDNDEFWDRKLDESYLHDFDNLVQDIQESGQVTMPVKLTVDEDPFPHLPDPTGHRSGLRVRQGHHRIASAVEVDPDMEVPVRHIVDDGTRWIGNAPRRNE